MAALLWNRERQKRAFAYDPAQSKDTPVRQAARRIGGRLAFFQDGSKLAMNIGGAAQPLTSDYGREDPAVPAADFQSASGVDLAAL